MTDTENPAGEEAPGARAGRLPVRVIHGQASTGATVFARVIAALPGVLMLNEVTPAGFRMAQNRFNPIDPLEQLFARMGDDFALSDAEHCALFVARLRPILSYCRDRGLILVIRDHSHSDYMMSWSAAPLLPKALRMLEDEIDLRSLLLVRYPLSSFMTAKASGFLDAMPHYQAYCARYLQFVRDYAEVPRLKYEFFTEDPRNALREACTVLGLTFSESALSRFTEIDLSGNSGRHAGDRVVHPALMREFGPVMQNTARHAPAARELCALLSYAADPVKFAQLSAQRVLNYDPNSKAAEEAYRKWTAILAQEAPPPEGDGAAPGAPAEPGARPA